MAPNYKDRSEEIEFRNTNDENKTYTIKDILASVPAEAEKPIDIADTIDEEIKAIINEEIKKAAHELAEEQKLVIRAAVEENKRIIREILAQEIAAIQNKEDYIRQTLLSYRQGR